MRPYERARVLDDLGDANGPVAAPEGRREWVVVTFSRHLPPSTLAFSDEGYARVHYDRVCRATKDVVNPPLRVVLAHRETFPWRVVNQSGKEWAVNLAQPVGADQSTGAQPSGLP